jgi:hypothetical protein
MSKSFALAAVGLSCMLAILLLFSRQKSNPNKSGTKTDTTGSNSTGIDTTPQKKYYVITLAGTGQAGFVNGPDTLAQFNVAPGGQCASAKTTSMDVPGREWMWRLACRARLSPSMRPIPRDLPRPAS